jgi:hypothetical protein
MYQLHGEADPQLGRSESVGFLFALFPIAIGLLLWWLGIKGVMLGRKQRNWPCVQGTITASSVATRDVDVPLLGKTTMRSTGWSGSGVPQVTYEYKVNGQTYSGHNVGTPPERNRWFGRRQRGTRDYDLSLFDLGRAAEVHYNPANPSDAVLFKHKGGGCALVVLWLVGGVFITFGWIAWGVVNAFPS